MAKVLTPIMQSKNGQIPNKVQKESSSSTHTSKFVGIDEEEKEYSNASYSLTSSNGTGLSNPRHGMIKV